MTGAAGPSRAAAVPAPARLTRSACGVSCKPATGRPSVRPVRARGGRREPFTRPRRHRRPWGRYSPSTGYPRAPTVGGAVAAPRHRPGNHERVGLVSFPPGPHHPRLAHPRLRAVGHRLPRSSRAPMKPQSEADWTAWIIDVAQWLGWKVVHFRPARTADGRWRTPMQGNKGFPDLVLCRAGRIIIAELKTDCGRLTADQKAWMSELGELGRVWRPSSRDKILEELR